MNEPRPTSACIRQRRTLKVLADVDHPWPPPDPAFRALMVELIELAACAPFHYTCDASHHTDALDSPAPWRFYAADGRRARMLLEHIQTLDEPLGKIGSMLAAADGLVMVTWLPDPAEQAGAVEFQSFVPSQRNMEHIAATAAAIQNMLLAATEHGVNNYWSSGGAVLRGKAAYEHLGIPRNQVLLGAVFLFPSDTKDADTIPGANRGKCGPQSRWVRWV
jgi:nitroreductase